MNIITHNLEKILKIKLKDIINSSLDRIVSNISSIFDTNNSNKYVSIINSISEEQKNLFVKVIEETLNYLDLKYKNSAERKKSKFLINKSLVPRTITTIFGEITIFRTYYQSKLNGSYHFLLDEELGLEKYDKYDQIVKAIAIDNTFKTNQKLAGELVGMQLTPLSQLIDSKAIRTISRQSINNWISKWNVPNFDLPDINTPKVLYIMVDEKYLGSQDLNNDIMTKVFVSFEGIEQVSKGRRRLVNRLVFSFYGKDAWNKYVDWLYKIYDSEKIETIYVMSDGGTWIKSGIGELKSNPNQVIKRLLCEFHFKQAINRMTTDKDYRGILNLSFKHDSKKDFVGNVRELLTISPEREKSICDNLNYIINNYKPIKDMINFEIGSSMESHISHLIASFFSSRPKGFSSKKINKYLKINDYKNNGINLFDIYLKSYNKKEVITINEEEPNFSLSSTSTNSNLPILNGTNISNKIKYKINKIKTANAIF